MNGEGDFGNNPNPNVMAEDEESAISSSTLSYDSDQDGESMRRGRGKSAYQIQELENFFKNDHMPTVDERYELAQRLNLEPDQVKNWFQNKRNQVKNKERRVENRLLKEENERLSEANAQLKHTLQRVSMYTFLAPTNYGDRYNEKEKLRRENARMQQEIDQLKNFLRGLGSGVEARTVKEGPTQTWTPYLGW